MNRRLAPVVAAMVIAAGCGGTATPTSPPSSSAVSLAGTWSGSITDPISGDGTAQLSLSDQGADAMTGTWSATFRNGDSVSGLASASLGAPTGPAIMLYANPQPACAGTGGSALLGFTLINVNVTSSRLTAVVGRISCSGFGFGTIDLSKQ